MRTLASLTLFAIVLTFTACNESASLKDKIAEQEEQLYSGDNQEAMNEELMSKLTDNYIKYATENPEDTLAPDYLFKAADISMNLGKDKVAMDQLDKILKNYPEFEKSAETMFLKAYIYENYQGELANARKFYKAFLNKYPNHEFADDVEMSLLHLGKSPEELVKQFEKKSAGEK